MILKKEQYEMDKLAKKYYLIKNLIFFAVTIVLVVFYLLFREILNFSYDRYILFTINFLPLLVIAKQLYDMYFIKNYSYTIIDDKVIVVRGVITKTKTVLKITSIRDVTIGRDLIKDKFGIVNLKIVGVNENVNIKCINSSLAEQFKEKLLGKNIE